MGEATFDLQFDIVNGQNSFHEIKKISFQVIELLLTSLQFPIQNYGKIINRGSDSC